MVKFTAGLNIHGERIEEMNECGDNNFCPYFAWKDNWEHIVKCDHKRDQRDYWMNR